MAKTTKKKLTESAAPAALDPRDEQAAALIRDMRSVLGDEEAVKRFLMNLSAPATLAALVKYKHPPVSIREFVEGAEYLDKKDVMWPGNMAEMEEMNSGAYIEAILTGAIGTGKTSVALYSQAYQLYLLSCLRDPHKEYGLDSASEIVIIFQSKNKAIAKAVDFDRFKEMVATAPYFRNNFSFDSRIESELQFPNRIVVKPVSGEETGAIGQNVIGGVIDEINFMAVIAGSSKSKDGNTYNQAMQNYNAIARRRESRFMQKGALPGLLCLVSSRNYPGQFTDKKEQERRDQILKYGKSPIFLYDKRVWEVCPPGRYGGEWFDVYLGDALTKPRILREGEQVRESEKPLVMRVPAEHRKAFDADILSAIRDICGQSTYALHPFMPDPEKVKACFGVVRSVLSNEECDFVESGVQLWPDFFRMREEPRYIHIDLGLTGDSAGIACGYVPRFVVLDRGDGVKEFAPEIVYDFVLEVKPPKAGGGGEINFAKIRKLIFSVKKFVPVKWASLDSFQSRDSIQILREQGIIAGLVSLDTDMTPYSMFKTALMDNRVKAPQHARAMDEVTRLERDLVKQKVDHPANGSKDCADAMCGVAFGLSMRREIWAKHGALRYAPNTANVGGPTVRKNERAAA